MKVVLLSGGVGGARMARGLAALARSDLSVIVNVGDDEELYGLAVSPDLDTVLYTLAGREGPQGWGLAGDTFAVMGHLGELGEDVRFRIGDRDLATNLARTKAVREGTPLSAVTERLASSLGITARILPVTDDRLRTRVLTSEGVWLSFQEYFVMRGHQDEVADLSFEGAQAAKPGPGVMEAIDEADLVVIGPSNPPLSIWPILAVPGLAERLAAQRVVAVSPLFAGKALKGPADRVLSSLGFAAGNAGVVAAYDGLVDDMVIDRHDSSERPALQDMGVAVHLADTRITEPPAAMALAQRILSMP